MRSRSWIEWFSIKRSLLLFSKEADFEFGFDFLNTCTKHGSYLRRSSFKTERNPEAISHILGCYAGHYILRVEALHGLKALPSIGRATEVSALHHQLEKPRFKLAGLAIGNGLTAPAVQVHAFTVHLRVWVS